MSDASKLSLVLELDELIALAKECDFNEMPREVIFFNIIDHFKDKGINTFKAIDIRNIFVASKHLKLSTELCSEAQCKKYLDRELGVKPYLLGVHEDTYRFNDKDYSEKTKLKKANNQEERKRVRESKSSLNITYMKTFLSSKNQSEEIHSKPALHFSPEYKNIIAIRFYKSPNLGNKNFTASEIEKALKCFVDFFGAEYSDYYCHHLTDQADGEGYAKDGKHLHSMLHGFGSYVSAGNIKFIPRKKSIFYEFLHASIGECFVLSEYATELSISEHGIILSIGTDHTIPPASDLDSFYQSSLKSMLAQAFAFATNKLPLIDIS